MGDNNPNDRIALARGLPPIAEPYVRAAPLPSRRWLHVLVVFSIVCMVSTAGVLMWAVSV